MKNLFLCFSLLFLFLPSTSFALEPMAEVELKTNHLIALLSENDNQEEKGKKEKGEVIIQSYLCKIFDFEEMAKRAYATLWIKFS